MYHVSCFGQSMYHLDASCLAQHTAHSVRDPISCILGGAAEEQHRDNSPTMETAALHCTALHCTTPLYTALHCSALHCTFEGPVATPVPRSRCHTPQDTSDSSGQRDKMFGCPQECSAVLENVWCHEDILDLLWCWSCLDIK